MNRRDFVKMTGLSLLSGLFLNGINLKKDLCGKVSYFRTNILISDRGTGDKGKS